MFVISNFCFINLFILLTLECHGIYLILQMTKNETR